MASLGTFVSLAFLGILMLMTLNYGQTMMASTDTGVNMTGSAYASTYNESQDSTIASLSFMKMLPYFIGIAALIGALFLMIPSKNIGL